jgi:hypothetical protein
MSSNNTMLNNNNILSNEFFRLNDIDFLCNDSSCMHTKINIDIASTTLNSIINNLENIKYSSNIDKENFLCVLYPSLMDKIKDYRSIYIRNDYIYSKIIKIDILYNQICKSSYIKPVDYFQEYLNYKYGCNCDEKCDKICGDENCIDNFYKECEESCEENFNYDYIIKYMNSVIKELKNLNNLTIVKQKEYMQNTFPIVLDTIKDYILFKKKNDMIDYLNKRICNELNIELSRCIFRTFK